LSLQPGAMRPVGSGTKTSAQKHEGFGAEILIAMRTCLIGQQDAKSL